MNYSVLITIAVFAVVFAILWWTGQLVRFRAYIEETREELKKCTWPTWDELKGSTVVVMISMAIIGLFTVGVDFLCGLLVQWIT